ncbi:MAG: NEW3 domain-containing protein [Solimonas sp.]
MALDVGKIEINEKLARGGNYQLPAIGVRNPGTETTTYRMEIDYAGGQRGRQAPQGWFRFDPAELTLAPGETKPVSVKLDIPASARPDDYEALLQAEVRPDGGGATVGAAAAARLHFTVKPSNILHAWRLEASDWFDADRPWTILAPAMVVTAFALWWLRRKFTVSVGRRA